jgi:hypothetical protein
MIFIFNPFVSMLNTFESMLFNMLPKLALGITIAFLIGGCVCYLANKDKSDACYITFAISLCMCVAMVAFTIFFGIVEYCDRPSKPWGPSALSGPSVISGPILPLSSSPSSPSKILVSRRTP